MKYVELGRATSHDAIDDEIDRNGCAGEVTSLTFSEIYSALPLPLSPITMAPSWKPQIGLIFFGFTNLLLFFPKFILKESKFKC